jgi:hypothetical protein
MVQFITGNVLARPAILMFDDWEWIDVRWQRQSERFSEWRKNISAPVVIEIRAGSTIPTVRRFSDHQDCAIIRMNPREWRVSDTPFSGSKRFQVAATKQWQTPIRRLSTPLVRKPEPA